MVAQGPDSPGMLGTSNRHLNWRVTGEEASLNNKLVIKLFKFRTNINRIICNVKMRANLIKASLCIKKLNSKT